MLTTVDTRPSTILSSPARTGANMDASYYWCLACRRAYPAELARVAKGRLWCAYMLCDAPHFASITWAYLRQMPGVGECLPEAPVWGRVYPLYIRDGQLYWE